MAAAPPPFLFDLDGTLADTLPDIAVSVNHVRASYGLPPLELAAVRTMVGDGARMLLARALHDLHPGAALLDAAFASYFAHHRVQCTITVQAFPGVREHLQRLRRAGHPLAVVTNKPAAFARAILAHLQLEALLPVVIGGDSLTGRKPDPAPLHAALQALGQPPGRGTMVGDSEQDLRAGKAAGLQTIACLFGYRDAALLRAEAADQYWTVFGG